MKDPFYLLSPRLEAHSYKVDPNGERSGLGDRWRIELTFIPLGESFHQRFHLDYLEVETSVCLVHPSHPWHRFIIQVLAPYPELIEDYLISTKGGGTVCFTYESENPGQYYRKLRRGLASLDLPCYQYARSLYLAGDLSPLSTRYGDKGVFLAAVQLFLLHYQQAITDPALTLALSEPHFSICRDFLARHYEDPLDEVAEALVLENLPYGCERFLISLLNGSPWSSIGTEYAYELDKGKVFQFVKRCKP